ncbi:MAG: hypothetical protein KAJ70_03180 [Candidatus Omnitrophica bacterium]|nr:hypothetical protein [Candidatus Omnitrophota bacterium]
MDKELIKIVKEDLEFLKTKWNQDIDDASLRQTSPILRSLLIEGKLLQCAPYFNISLNVMAPLVSKQYELNNLDTIVFFQSGGAKYKGMEIQMLCQRNVALSLDEIKKTYEDQKDIIGKNYPEKLSKFLKQTSFVINSIAINREEVIKYVANKLGGVHYDSSRKVSNNISNVTLEDKYYLMDDVRKNHITADKNSIYYELLSIGQRLINSGDVLELLKRCNQVI